MATEEKKRIPVIPGVFEFKEGSAYLVGNRCSKCGKSFFPPRFLCSSCLTDVGMEKRLLGNSGRLYAFTEIRVSAPEFNPPYLFGYVILEPENIRIPTLITGVEDPSDLKTGVQMEMTLATLRKDERGDELITYMFQPLKRSQYGHGEKS